MRVSVIKSEHLVQGMIAAEDVYTTENQMILAHGMVLNPFIIGLLQNHKVDDVKVCSDSVGETEVYQFKTTHSRKITTSTEYQNFDREYTRLAAVFHGYIHEVVRSGMFADTEPLVESIKRLYACTSEKVHELDIISNRPSKEQKFISHSINVALFSYICADLIGMSESEKRMIILAGLFHDIGRIASPDIRIRRPDSETIDKLMNISESFDAMKEHIVYGYELLKMHGFDEKIYNTALHHHECMDGTGFLEAEKRLRPDIFLNIVGMTDLTEIVVFGKNCGNSINVIKAIEFFEKHGTMKFDTKLIRYILNRVAEKYLHHLVVLDNGIQGEIIEINRNILSAPIIKTNYGYIDLSKATQLKIEKIL